MIDGVEIGGRTVRDSLANEEEIEYGSSIADVI
jgi:hypothetical protein